MLKLRDILNEQNIFKPKVVEPAVDANWAYKIPVARDPENPDVPSADWASYNWVPSDTPATFLNTEKPGTFDPARIHQANMTHPYSDDMHTQVTHYKEPTSDEIRKALQYEALYNSLNSSSGLSKDNPYYSTIAQMSKDKGYNSYTDLIGGSFKDQVGAFYPRYSTGDNEFESAGHGSRSVPDRTGTMSDWDIANMIIQSQGDGDWRQNYTAITPDEDLYWDAYDIRPTVEGRIKLRNILLQEQSRKENDTEDALNRIKSHLQPDQWKRFQKLWQDLDAGTKNIFGANSPLHISYGHKSKLGIPNWSKMFDRAHYNPFGNTIHMGNVTPSELEKYTPELWAKAIFSTVVAELSHVQQRMDMGRTKFIGKFIAKDLPGHTFGHYDPYETEGSVEHEAHDTIEQDMMANIMGNYPKVDDSGPELYASKSEPDDGSMIKLKSLIPNSQQELEPLNNTPHDTQTSSHKNTSGPKSADFWDKKMADAGLVSPYHAAHTAVQRKHDAATTSWDNKYDAIKTAVARKLATASDTAPSNRIKRQVS
jgi:hypothetical protein